MNQDVLLSWLHNWIRRIQIPTYHVISVQIIGCWDKIISTRSYPLIPSLERRVPVDTYACRYLYQTKDLSKFMSWKSRPNSLKRWGCSQKNLVCPIILLFTLHGIKHKLLFVTSATIFLKHCVSLRSVPIMHIVMSYTLDDWRKLFVRIWERHMLQWIYVANVLSAELLPPISHPRICSNCKDRTRTQLNLVILGISPTYVSLDGINGDIVGKVRHHLQILMRSSAAASAPPRMKAMKFARVYYRWME